MAHHGVFLIHRTQPGRREAVRDVWTSHMAPAVSDNDDHLFYFYCFDDADPDVICVFQLYRDADAATAFLDHPNYIQYIAAVEPLLAGPPEFHAATPEWTKSDAY